MSHEVPSCIRIQLLSDLHLEFERSKQGESSDRYKYDFPAKAEILALLGDVGETTDERLFEWLQEQLARFKLVFFLSGNNEPNGSTIVSVFLCPFSLRAQHVHTFCTRRSRARGCRNLRLNAMPELSEARR